MSDLFQDARTCAVQAKGTRVLCLSTRAQLKCNSERVDSIAVALRYVFAMSAKRFKVFQCSYLHCVLCGFSFSHPGFYHSCSKVSSASIATMLILVQTQLGHNRVKCFVISTFNHCACHSRMTYVFLQSSFSFVHKCITFLNTFPRNHCNLVARCFAQIIL